MPLKFSSPSPSSYLAAVATDWEGFSDTKLASWLASYEREKRKKTAARAMEINVLEKG